MNKLMTDIHYLNEQPFIIVKGIGKMKKPTVINLKPYVEAFTDQTSRTVVSTEQDKVTKIMFQKGRTKSFICIEELLSDLIPQSKSQNLPTIAITLTSAIPESTITLSDIVDRVVDNVNTYYPNQGNQRLTVVLDLVVPPQKDENGTVMKPKKSDSPISLIITINFPDGNYEFKS